MMDIFILWKKVEIQSSKSLDTIQILIKLVQNGIEEKGHNELIISHPSPKNGKI